MERYRLLTMGVMVMGALLIGTFAPYSEWGRSAEKTVEIPTVSASWFEAVSMTDQENDPTRITIAAPPYIILGPVPNQNERVIKQPEIRISIQTMSGSYSEYVALKFANDSNQPVMLATSKDMGSSPNLLSMAD